jgi:hypothetical protein
MPGDFLNTADRFKLGELSSTLIAAVTGAQEAQPLFWIVD